MTPAARRERDAEILRMRREGASRWECALEFGISTMRVYQIERENREPQGDGR